MLWDTCLDVWIEINHAVPIEIAWWIPQHMRYYRKLWVCVLYMDTVTFNIYYILLNINTKIHLILLKIRRGVIYIFFQCGTSIFTGKTCTVITTKVEIVKLLKYCLRSLKCLQALCKQGRRNSCVHEVWLTQGRWHIRNRSLKQHQGQDGLVPSWAVWGRPLAAEREW